jgi:hypothetical protein
MHFTPKTLWLKDYYSSRIKSEIRQASENEGIICKRAINDSNSSHLYYQTEHDESGITPPRFLVEHED